MTVKKPFIRIRGLLIELESLSRPLYVYEPVTHCVLFQVLFTTASGALTGEEFQNITIKSGEPIKSDLLFDRNQTHLYAMTSHKVCISLHRCTFSPFACPTTTTFFTSALHLDLLHVCVSHPHSYGSSLPLEFTMSHLEFTPSHLEFTVAPGIQHHTWNSKNFSCRL